MKKNTTLLFLILISFGLKAQQFYTNPNYIFFSPARPFPEARNWAIITNGTHEGDLQIATGDTNTSGIPDINTTPALAKLTISHTGAVGIGTANPLFKLDVEGNTRIKNSLSTFGALSAFRVQGPDYTNGLEIGSFGNNNIPSDLHWSYGGGAGSAFVVNMNAKPLTFGTDNKGRMIIDADGNVGIGTFSPNQKLTVNGTIYGTEVIIDLNVPAPDYVFEQTYDLLPLNELKVYIEKHRHLPEVPAAKEMEANGINVVEMNMILLKKIEELTLHLIKANEKIESLNKQVQPLKNGQ